MQTRRTGRSVVRLAHQAARRAVRLAGAAALVGLGGALGCHHLPPCDQACVSQHLEERTGQGLGPPAPPGKVLRVPDGLLTEDQALTVALWNNPALLEALVDIGLTQADLLQARLLPNPELVYYPPSYDKVYKYLADFPVESLWLRPLRIKVARRENARACQRLVQVGLDLIRDVRAAYADLLISQARLRVAEDSVRLRDQIATIAAARLKAGDIGPQEEATARIDALLAQQELARARNDVPVVESRLRNLLGLSGQDVPLALDSGVPAPQAPLELEPLLAEAVATRPDVLAAQTAIEAFQERLRLAKCSWIRLLGILDATSGLKRDHEPGAGFRITIPIFNQGQGGIARAEAELERAIRQKNTLEQQALFDVRRSFALYEQARAELAVLEGKVLPEVEAAIARSRRAYQEGNATYLIVLETTRQFLDSRLRQAQLQGDLRRAWAELERSVGRRLIAPPLAHPGAQP